MGTGETAATAPATTGTALALPKATAIDPGTDLLIQIKPQVSTDFHTSRGIGAAPDEIPRLQLRVLNHRATLPTDTSL